MSPHAVDHHHPAAPTPTPRRSGLAWAKHYRFRLRLSDALIITLAVFVAVLVPVAGSQLSGLAAIEGRGILAIVVVGLWLLTMAALHTRDSSVLGVGIGEYKRVVNACTLTFGLLGIAFVTVQALEVRMFFVIAFPLGLALLVGSRWLWRNWLVHQGTLGHALSRVVVVGQRRDVEFVVRQIARSSGAAYSVVGVVLDEEPPARTSAAQTGVAAASAALDDIPVRHDLDRVPTVVSEFGADAVIVAGQFGGRRDFVRTLAWDLEGSATALILATSLANVAGPRIHLRPMEGLPLIHVEIPQFEGGKHLLKRAFDVVVAGFALVLLAPLFAVLALAIRIDSPGPAFFSQERVGRDGRRFTIWKFRTMRTTAPEQLDGLLDHNDAAGVLFKMKNDPRVTRLGRPLRTHSLDELPQLWNIFVGDMSLVGPRPPLPREVAHYEDHVHRRLYIRPGLTGMWQINGRSSLSWEESVQLDLYYVENWSLVGDIVIMWRTLRQVSHPVGAY